MIEVHDLDIRGSLDVQILGGVSVNLETGQTVAAVGGSGAGKTTLGLALLGFVRPGMRRVGGAVRFDGQDMFGLTDAELRRLRRESIAYLPQNPASTLTPTMRIEDLVEERRLAHSKPTEHLLELVHLPCDRTFRRRYPHQLSIGQQ
ncbi:MAG: ATP-binding cassette domain-containing protein, partial [Chloroflexi bacterium]|nr:ATP-binding cassette domain-containing protein [Chloroflexota bacterium]